MSAFHRMGAWLSHAACEFVHLTFQLFSLLIKALIELQMMLLIAQEHCIDRHAWRGYVTIKGASTSSTPLPLDVKAPQNVTTRSNKLCRITAKRADKY